MPDTLGVTTEKGHAQNQSVVPHRDLQLHFVEWSVMSRKVTRFDSKKH